MNRLYRLLKFLSKSLAFLTLFVFSTYILVGRLLFYTLPDYGSEIEKYLSNQTQLPIVISSLRGEWIGFDPLIKIEGLEVNGSENAYLGSVSIHVSVFRSILAGSIRINLITLDNSAFYLRQEKNGSWDVAGLDFADGSSEGKKSLGLDSLLDGARFILSNNLVSVTDSAGKLKVWNLPSISLNYQGDQIFASGQVLQPEGTQPLLKFAYEGISALSIGKIFGTLYLEARSSIFLNDLLKAYEWEGFSILDVDASARAWVSIDGDKVSNVLGDIQISELNLKAKQNSLPALTNMAVSIEWKNFGSESELNSYWSGLNWADQECGKMSSRVEFGETTTRASVSSIDVQCVSRMASEMEMVPEKLKERLAVSKPSGNLANVSLLIDHQESTKNEPFQFEAELENVSLAAYSGTPGGFGIDGYIYADSKGGSVIFDSERFVLSFPDLYLEPFKMKRTEGAVSWLLKGEDTLVYSEGLRLRMQDDSLVYGDFLLRLNPDDKEDYLNLALGLQDIDFKDVTKLVPYYVVSKDIYEWLDESLLEGKATSGIYYGYGSIESDETENKFTTSLLVNTKQGELKFAEGWPELKGLNAQVNLQNGGLIVQSKTALIKDTQLHDLLVEMPESSDDSPSILNAKAWLRSNKNTLQYWLRESPIADRTRDIANQIDVRGEFDVALDIDVPMVSTIPVGYEITSTFNDVEIEHPGSSLVFKHVQGLLQVSSKTGLSAENVKMELMGQPALFSLLTNERLAANQTLTETIMELSGKSSVAALLRNYQLPDVYGLSGIFDYQSELRLFSASDQYPEFSLSTDLRGVSMEWPEPFDKLPSESGQLKLAMLIKPNQIYVDTNVHLDAAPNVDSELLFVDKDFSFGEVKIGRLDSGSQVSSGLNILAKLPNITLEPWIEFVDELSGNSDYENSRSILEHLDIEVQQLEAFGQDFSRTQAVFNRENSRWRVDIDGGDVAGKVLLAKDEDILHIQLDHLKLSSEEGSDSNVASNDKDSLFDPRNLPAMSFSSKEISLDGQNYGAWKATLEPSEEGVIFRSLDGQVGGAHITGQLNWRRLSDQLHNSILTLDLSGNNVENLIKNMGWPSVVSSDRYQAELALVWPDEPSSFDIANVSGNIGISMNDGALKTDDGKTGALRLFGILNAEAVLRRLTLDFSDLFSSGVSYDDLSVRATIDQGRLVLDKPLLIDGPSSSYTINGSADLTNKTLDMDMLVELPFSQNVPLAALVLGAAPQVGGAVWLVDKLLGEPLSSISTVRYDITGPWDNLKIDLRQAINAQKKKRSGKERFE